MNKHVANAEVRYIFESCKKSETPLRGSGVEKKNASPFGLAPSKNSTLLMLPWIAL